MDQNWRPPPLITPPAKKSKTAPLSPLNKSKNNDVNINDLSLPKIWSSETRDISNKYLTRQKSFAINRTASDMGIGLPDNVKVDINNKIEKKLCTIP